MNTIFPGLVIGGNVSNGEFSDGSTSRSQKSMTNESGWSHDLNMGINQSFRRENAFHSQELYNRVSRGFVSRRGTIILYYATTFNVSGDPLYFEDNNRIIQRVFKVPVMTTFQSEKEMYGKFGLSMLDESEMHMHMGLFLELNYQSLRNYGIKPTCDPTAHNPFWSQRGYEKFNYHGYSFDQIGPKAGDKMKIEAFNELYEIENVMDASPEFQFMWRKYFWKCSYKSAYDSGQTIDTEVLNDVEQRDFLQTVTGNMSDPNVAVDFPIARNSAVDKLKKDILFRPPEVPQSAPDISQDPNFYPGFDKMGGW